MFSRVVFGCLTLAVGTASFAAGGGDSPNLLEPKWGTIVWTFITFLLLAFLLGKFAWKPLLGALDDRQRSIEGSLDEARQEREQAAKLLDEHKSLVAQAHRERAEAVAKGERDAELLKAEILDQARQQREQLLKQTDEQVKAGIAQAQTSLRSMTADLAIKAAEKLLARDLDDATHRKLVESYLDDLERGAPERGAPPS